MTTIAVRNTTKTGLGQKLACLIAALVDRYAKYQTYRELSQLDDQILKDIGVNRADISANGLQDLESLRARCSKNF